MKKLFSAWIVVLFFGIILSLAPSCKKESSTPDPVIPVVKDSADPVQFEAPFTKVPATSDIVMYEINERAFSASGNFAGILPRLDSIKSLGVNVIWLMPVFPIGQVKSINSPYCVQNYTQVNPEFGTLNDLRNLVREAHKRDMAVILDWVANHTSWDNTWIKNKSWYTQDGSGNIISPAGTNWQDVADLNFDNADLRKAMIKALKYWVLTTNIDGYRCDAADMVPFSFWKQAIDSLKTIPNRSLVMLAEGSRPDHFYAGFHLNFGWEFFSKNKDVFQNNQSPSALYQAHQKEYSSIPSGAQKLRFISNHDECAWDDTPIGLFGGERGSMAAFVITAYMGGVPLIYNGQEIGYPVKLPFFSRLPIDWTISSYLLPEYKSILGFRSGHPALRNGSLTNYSDAAVACFLRTYQQDEVLVLVNTRHSSSTFTIPSGLAGTEWTNGMSGEMLTLSGQISLGAFEYLILTKN